MHQLLVAFDGFAPAVTVLFPVAVLTAAVSVVLRSHLWRTVSTPHDPVIDAMLVYSVLAAGILVFTPQPDLEARVQVFPGDDLWLALRAAPGDAHPWVQLAGNLLLLLPLGALVPLRVPWFHNLFRITLGGLLTACTIEIVQLLTISGRVASTDDVVLNTSGVLIGGLLVRGPWWQAVPDSGAAALSTVGPQHSGAAQRSQTVWRLIEKIEGERIPSGVSEPATVELPVVAAEPVSAPRPSPRPAGTQRPLGSDGVPNRGHRTQPPQAPDRPTPARPTQNRPASNRPHQNRPVPNRQRPASPEHDQLGAESLEQEYTGREYPALGKRLREPARHS